MSDLFSFIYAMLGQWVAIMSGIVSLVLTLALRTRNKEVSNKLFWAIAIVFLLIASFLAWREEHQAHLKSRQELSEAKDQSIPRLSGQIDQMEVVESSGANGAQIFIQLSVRNTGAPSIAEKFSLKIQSGSFQYHNTPTELPKEYTLTPIGKSLKISLRHEDSIDAKTVKPIERGSLERGWLRFDVPDVKPEMLLKPGMRYIIHFADILGDSHSVDYVVPGGAT